MNGPSAHPTKLTLKFLCSYDGKILPRYPDGKLRYLGGVNHVLAVPRSISFSELLLKMGELCGTTVTLRCQLPTDDLDVLISIKNDEDLANIIAEYDTAAANGTLLKIRAILSLPAKKLLSSSSSSNHSTTTTCDSRSSLRFSVPFPAKGFVRQVSNAAPFRQAPAAPWKAHPLCANCNHAYGNPTRPPLPPRPQRPPPARTHHKHGAQYVIKPPGSEIQSGRRNPYAMADLRKMGYRKSKERERK